MSKNKRVKIQKIINALPTLEIIDIVNVINAYSDELKRRGQEELDKRSKDATDAKTKPDVGTKIKVVNPAPGVVQWEATGLVAPHMMFEVGWNSALIATDKLVMPYIRALLALEINAAHAIADIVNLLPFPDEKNRIRAHVDVFRRHELQLRLAISEVDKWEVQNQHAGLFDLNIDVSNNRRLLEALQRFLTPTAYNPDSLGEELRRTVDFAPYLTSLTRLRTLGKRRINDRVYKALIDTLGAIDQGWKKNTAAEVSADEYGVSKRTIVDIIDENKLDQDAGARMYLLESHAPDDEL